MIRQPRLSPLKLRLARETAELCTAGAARRLGVTRGSVCHWEAGRRTPDANTVAEMAALYGWSIGALYDWPEEEL